MKTKAIIKEITLMPPNLDIKRLYSWDIGEGINGWFVERMKKLSKKQLRYFRKELRDVAKEFDTNHRAEEVCGWYSNSNRLNYTSTSDPVTTVYNGLGHSVGLMDAVESRTFDGLSQSVHLSDEAGSLSGAVELSGGLLETIRNAGNTVTDATFAAHADALLRYYNDADQPILGYVSATPEGEIEAIERSNYNISTDMFESNDVQGSVYGGRMWSREYVSDMGSHGERYRAVDQHASDRVVYSARRDGRLRLPNLW